MAEVDKNGSVLSTNVEGVPEVTSRSLVGSVTFLVSDEDLIEPLYEDWEPEPIA
jgi:hypothetical protein